MKPEELIKELRAQRELLQKHLDWLDQKIADLDDSELKEESQEPQPQKENVPPEADKVEEDKHEELEVTALIGDPASKIVSDYKAATGSELQRAKIGCLVLFLLGIGLFLFLLFVLPYLLY